MFDDKIETEGSVFQELCHIVIPPDGTDINGHHRTRNGFTGLETDIKQIRPDTNG